MGQKIYWLDNLRGMACIMVVMIHASTSYVIDYSAIATASWNIANVLNAASRVSVPLFFMISGALFFGEKNAQPRHFLRIGLCFIFYSLLSLIYIASLTKIGFWPSFKHMLQKPVFYHLWFFYAIGIIYLLSPLIQVKATSGRYLLMLCIVVGVLANPQLPKLNWQGVPLLPLNLYISGDTFYYVLYALLGRAISTLKTERPAVSWATALLFIIATLGVAIGTRVQSHINQNFAATFYAYCSPLVFIAALALFVWAKNCLASRTLPGLSAISRHSLAIYGFHAFIIIGLRSLHLPLPGGPLVSIALFFICGLFGGLLLAILLSKIDRRHWVS
ncbi:acyltransferase [Rouxiella sp. Mn2063]|uniref:acyltransferase n=1 Tax=Rouxiella sp. Mn2063 TaxID=3395262 RepID=UPI003BC2E7B2